MHLGTDTKLPGSTITDVQRERVEMSKERKRKQDTKPQDGPDNRRMTWTSSLLPATRKPPPPPPPVSLIVPLPALGVPGLPPKQSCKI